MSKNCADFSCDSSCSVHSIVYSYSNTSFTLFSMISLTNKGGDHALDSYSRYMFTAKGFYGECFEPTQKEFRRVFQEYGLPKQIHTDNGRPFGAVQAIQRITRLSVWFIEHGIEPVYSDPAHAVTYLSTLLINQ